MGSPLRRPTLDFGEEPHEGKLRAEEKTSSKMSEKQEIRGDKSSLALIAIIIVIYAVAFAIIFGMMPSRGSGNVPSEQVSETKPKSVPVSASSASAL